LRHSGNNISSGGMELICSDSFGGSGEMNGIVAITPSQYGDELPIYFA